MLHMREVKHKKRKEGKKKKTRREGWMASLDKRQSVSTLCTLFCWSPGCSTILRRKMRLTRPWLLEHRLEYVFVSDLLRKNMRRGRVAVCAFPRQHEVPRGAYDQVGWGPSFICVFPFFFSWITITWKVICQVRSGQVSLHHTFHFSSVLFPPCSCLPASSFQPHLQSGSACAGHPHASNYCPAAVFCLPVSTVLLHFYCK